MFLKKKSDARLYKRINSEENHAYCIQETGREGKGNNSELPFPGMRYCIKRPVLLHPPEIKTRQKWPRVSHVLIDF